MGYIATCAARQGYNVGVIDAEALGLGISGAADLVNRLAPRWAGFNLLAPTYEISAQIATGLDPAISIMVGGHQARAMPIETLTDPRFARCEALVLGEGETRVAELLRDKRARTELPGVMWRDPSWGHRSPAAAWVPAARLSPPTRTSRSGRARRRTSSRRCTS
jgi:anaerobic magnesium-protoporphyrin IX monomethyl ester cyclase